MRLLIWPTDERSGPQSTTDTSPTGEQKYQARVRAGAQAPRFRLPDQHGRAVTLGALLTKGPVVLRFWRQHDTSSCFRELDGLAALHVEIEKRGSTLAVIAAQPLHPHPADIDAAAYAFLLLTDKGARVARSYGLTYGSPPARRSPATAEDRTESLKQRARNGSAPATYIVDQESVVALAFVDLEGRSRMEPDQIVTALDCLSKRKERKGGAPDGADRGERL
jgi:peroxiredoxin